MGFFIDYWYLLIAILVAAALIYFSLPRSRKP